MRNKISQLYILIVTSFIIDVAYYFGFRNLIDMFIDYSIGWFGLALIGFVCSYFLLYKTDIKHKAVLNIIITIGALINLCLIALWYLLKDFGF